MSSIISPNMQLVIPGVGSQPGPQYASDIDNSLTLIDQHNHTIGSGVQIPTSGLNINTSLPMNNNLLSLPSAVNFQVQTVDPVPVSIYAKGVDLYYIDGSSNIIRITQSGSVAGSSGTITGLPSGTASASFGASTFVFQSATNTAANIDGAAIILRNSTANSFGITLQPPSALGSNYPLTLPALPAQTNVMSLDPAGNMGSITYDAVGQGMTSAGANPIGQAMTTVGANSIASVTLNANFPGTTVQEGGRNVVVANTNAATSHTIIRGTFDGSGNILSGEGFTVARAAAGNYVVTYSTPVASPPTVTANCINTGGGPFVAFLPGAPIAASFQVYTFNTISNSQTDVSVSFIVIGNR